LMERLDAFMARANTAYYATRDPFADFTTSPEISQVFGELLGLWAAVMWRAMGAPPDVILAEAGPGRGTLMADALRAIGRAAPDFRPAVHLVESSARLRAIQAEKLPSAVWHDRVEDMPPGPMVSLANEFLDALPIRQLRGDGEAFVVQGERVWWPASDAPIQETCEPALGIVRTLAARDATALFLDYGPTDSAPGDSLQAIRDGAPADPFIDPGTADLTAHVDFAALARTARAAGAAVYGPVPQGKFLASLGLFQRTGILARIQPPAKAGAMIEAAQRLAEPNRMGRLFKAMAICHPGLPTPPGFET